MSLGLQDGMARDAMVWDGLRMGAGRDGDGDGIAMAWRWDVDGDGDGMGMGCGCNVTYMSGMGWGSDGMG